MAEKDIKQQELAQAIATAMQLSNQQQFELQQAKEAELTYKSMDKSGLSTHNFRLKMEQEIAKGKYTEVTYYPALAAKFGNPKVISVSGYEVILFTNQTTKVPHSLVPIVNQKLAQRVAGSLDGIVVTDQNGKADPTLTAQAKEALGKALEHDLNK